MLAMIFKFYENDGEDRKKPSDMAANVAHKKGAASIKPMITTQMAL
jgi:hypothetical protein